MVNVLDKMYGWEGDIFNIDVIMYVKYDSVTCMQYMINRQYFKIMNLVKKIYNIYVLKYGEPDSFYFDHYEVTENNVLKLANCITLSYDDFTKKIITFDIHFSSEHQTEHYELNFDYSFNDIDYIERHNYLDESDIDGCSDVYLDHENTKGLTEFLTTFINDNYFVRDIVGFKRVRE